jgi:anti-sigma factor RsiW
VSHLDPELLALVALGEVAETADQHLADCAECRSEVDQFAATVAVARRGEGAMQLIQPPPELWDRIATAAGLESGPEPVGGEELAAPAPAGRRPRRSSAGRAGPWWRRHPLAAGLGGGLAGLIIGAGAVAGIHQLGRPPSAQVVASIPLRPLPQFPQWRGATGTAVMETGPTGRQLAVALRAPQRAGFYEVWLLARDGVSMISLGDLDGAHAGRFDLPPGVDLRNYSRIDVSLQPFDGSTLHAKTSVVRGSLP